jgi:hypothetical protein
MSPELIEAVAMAVGRLKRAAVFNLLDARNESERESPDAERVREAVDAAWNDAWAAESLLQALKSLAEQECITEPIPSPITTT